MMQNRKVLNKTTVLIFLIALLNISQCFSNDCVDYYSGRFAHYRCTFTTQLDTSPFKAEDPIFKDEPSLGCTSEKGCAATYVEQVDGTYIPAPCTFDSFFQMKTEALKRCRQKSPNYNAVFMQVAYFPKYKNNLETNYVLCCSENSCNLCGIKQYNP